MLCWFIRISISLIFINLTESALTSSIPQHLLECYRGEGVRADSSAPRRLDVLLEVVRRLEAERAQLDMRMLSVALLRSLRLDGIEQSQNYEETADRTPYRASAFQFHRCKLLLDLLLPAHGSADVGEELSGLEKCLAHRLLSGTVRRWERGDEAAVCPLSLQATGPQRQIDPQTGRSYSRCPIEDGVTWTHWGTIAPGTLVAALASSLQQQTVPMADLMNVDSFRKSAIETLDEAIETLDDVIETSRVENAEINNIHVATLAGDLAEVAVNQGPRVGAVAQNISIGSNNRWNDTELPRLYYMFPQNEDNIQWHITDAEILAGIDGLILAREITKWTSQLGSLRLSQVIEMYYSHAGVSFDANIKACNRNSNFYRIFDQAEILREMSNFARMLALSQGTVYVPAEELQRICQNVVTAFVAYVNDVINRNQFACRQDSHVPEMNLIVTTDGAWKRYQNEQFLSSVSLSADLLSSHSTLGFMHGNTGVWIVPPVHNVTGIFQNIDLFTDEWPNRLNFRTILSSLNVHLTQERLNEASTGASVASPTVILITSVSDRLTTEDLEASRDLMRHFRHNNFDTHFIFLAQDLSSFYDLNSESDEYADLFLEVKSTDVTEAGNKVRDELPNADIPKRIIGNICDVNGTQVNQVPYEDFISVNQKISYRIHPRYLHATQLVTVTFRATIGGEIRVCSARQDAEGQQHCQQLGERQQTTFNLTEPCARSQQCAPAYFTVTGVSTLNTCANMDCRYPSQIAFYVQHTGLQCLSLQNEATRNSSILTIICILLYCSFNFS